MGRSCVLWTGCLLLVLLTRCLCQAEYGPFFISGAYGPPQPSWSPDAKKLAFTVATKKGVLVHTVGVRGGKSRFLATGSDPSWSPRGDKIALVEEGGSLIVVAAQGGKARKLAEGPVWTDDSKLAWSPDGRMLAYQRWNRWQRPSRQYRETAFCGEVCVVDVQSGGVRQLTRVKEAFPEDAFQQNTDVYGWTDNGREVIAKLPAGDYGPAGLYAVDVQTQEPRLLVEGLMAFVSASPDARRLVGVQWEKDTSENPKASLVEVLPEDGKTRTVVSFGDGPHPWRLTVAWRQRTAVGAGPVSGPKSNYVLTLFKLDTSEARRLTRSPFWEAAPAVSGDGSLVAFYRYLNGKSSLCVMQADGTKARVVAPCNQ